jgi:hypothetical protein
MKTKLDFKVETEFEVIGSGGMIYTPCQIGEWWVIPANDYQGKIPPEVQQKMFKFLNRQIPYQGFLVADDIKNVKGKEEPTRESVPEVPQPNQTSFGDVLLGVGRVMLYMLAGVFMIFDPMLIAVLADGRWVCVGTWYD